MNAVIAMHVPRRRCHGVRQIVRFNWPHYALALVAATAALAIGRGASADLLRYSVAGLISMWLIGSVAASWIVYDRSPLMTGQWIRQTLGFLPESWINIHAGFDESTPMLQALLGGARGRIFDIFDKAEMTEASIVRARRLAAPSPTSEAVDFRHLPLPANSIDAVFLLLSAHELRTDAARRALFTEVRRVLTLHGRAIVAEHLRDWPNTLAFGPGALHFHSRRTWIRSFEPAGLRRHDEFSMTPFVHIFVLGRLL